MNIIKRIIGILFVWGPCAVAFLLVLFKEWPWWAPVLAFFGPLTLIFTFCFTLPLSVHLPRWLQGLHWWYYRQILKSKIDGLSPLMAYPFAIFVELSLPEIYKKEGMIGVFSAVERFFDEQKKRSTQFFEETADPSKREARLKKEHGDRQELAKQQITELISASVVSAVTAGVAPITSVVLENDNGKADSTE